MTTIAAIDPGLDGAVAIMENGNCVDLLDMPVMQNGKSRRWRCFWATGTQSMW